jgi:hypothetical protein
MLSGNNHTGFQINEYGRTFREYHFVESVRKVESPCEGCVRYEPLSKSTNHVRAYLFDLQDMALSTYFSGLKGTRATSLNVDILVYIELRDLQSALINHTTTDG